MGWTRYDTRVLYTGYDITNVTSAGVNVAGVMIGHGWKDSRSYPPMDPGETADYLPVLMLQVIGTFSNGSKIVLLSSSDEWVGTQSPILDDSVYNGEVRSCGLCMHAHVTSHARQTYDARLEQDGWSTAGFANASNWSPVPLVREYCIIINTMQ